MSLALSLVFYLSLCLASHPLLITDLPAYFPMDLQVVLSH